MSGDIWQPKTWGKIFDGLRGNSEATLAGACLFAGFIMLCFGVNAEVAFAFPIAIYVLYLLRTTLREKHMERLAAKEVEMLERTKGAALQRKTQKALEQRRTK